MVSKLRYGNTNTFFIRGTSGNLLIDTDYAGTMPAFFRAIKANNIKISDISYVLATHERIDSTEATILSCENSRKFLRGIGIDGEIISTTSHSEDSISLILDNGVCIVGDLEPINYLEAYEENINLKTDWELIMNYNPKIIYYAHANEKVLKEVNPYLYNWGILNL